MNKGLNIKDLNITIILSMLFKPKSSVSSLFLNLFHPFFFALSNSIFHSILCNSMSLLL